jgi:putative ABC transport system ATP-binding protein
MSLIKLDNITKEYGQGDAKVVAINDISLTINKGEMIAIMGASGSGKSTLLNIIGCLDVITNGSYKLNNNEIGNFNNNKLARVRNKIFGFVVQYFALIDDYTVYQNISLPLEYSKVNRKERNDKIIKTLNMLNIIEKRNKLPIQLSGGQNQRVAIARAIVNNPDIILADEPTGALDKNNGLEVLKLLKELNDEGKTVIIVTHDEKVAKVCKRLITIEDGKIENDVEVNV